MIGVYDSGLGGLLELNKIKLDNPHTDILYLGDQDHAPYGNKTKAEIRQIFDQNLTFFHKYQVRQIILACNTLCSTIDFENYPNYNLFDLIKATAAGIDLPLNAGILVFATQSTINAGRYEQELAQKGYQNVKGVALPRLAEMIERFAEKEEIENYLFSLFRKIDYQPDAVILGCTHYPIVKDLFASYFQVPLYDSTDLDFRIAKSQEVGKIFIAMHNNEPIRRFIRRYVKEEVEFIAYEQESSFGIR